MTKTLSLIESNATAPLSIPDTTITPKNCVTATKHTNEIMTAPSKTSNQAPVELSENSL